MATPEQVGQIAQMIRLTPPASLFQWANESQEGIGAVLGYLNEAGTDVTAGEIAAFMDVSTARVAVLLKKMEAKGLIVRGRSDLDARVTMVRLTESGTQTAQRMKSNIYTKIAEAIDKIGMERLLDFFETARQISLLVPGPCADHGMDSLCEK